MNIGLIMKYVALLLIVICSLPNLHCGAGTSNDLMVGEKDLDDDAPEQADTAMADYNPLPLPRLIVAADRIILGAVSGIESDYVIVRLDELISGAAIESGTIRVKKYVPSKFDGPRPSPYALNQQFLFFLEAETDRESWKQVGIVGEGEIPVEAGFVYFTGSPVSKLPTADYEVHGASYTIARYPLDDFIEAIRGYPACFDWVLEEDQNRKRWHAVQRCSTAALEAYRASGWMQDYLAAESVQRLRAN